MDSEFQIPSWKAELVKKHFQTKCPKIQTNKHDPSSSEEHEIEDEQPHEGQLEKPINEILYTENCDHTASTPDGPIHIDNSNGAVGVNFLDHAAAKILQNQIRKSSIVTSECLADSVVGCPSINEAKISDARSGPVSPAVTSVKPKLIANKCNFPVCLGSMGIADYRDQGRNCVVVIIKSHPRDPQIQRQRDVQKKMKEIEKLKSKFRLKYNTGHHSEVRAVYNICFVSSADARKFVKGVVSVAASSSGRSARSIIHFLTTEEKLGYQFAPVLNEQELLTLHSPEIFQNVFKTSTQVTVANDENGDVKFIFKNVIEVNDFISNACNHAKAQTLGELKFNVKKYKLKPDEDKKFNLLSKDPEAMLEQYSIKHNFRVKNDRLGFRTLSFHEKSDMFSFLVSDEAGHLKHLQIDPELIGKNQSNDIKNMEVGMPCNEDGAMSFSAEDDVPALDPTEVDGDSGLNDSCATEASVFEAVIAQKDDEIRDLKDQLLQKRSLLERKENENKKIESKFFEAQNYLEQIQQLSIKSANHVLPVIKNQLKENSENRRSTNCQSSNCLRDEYVSESVASPSRTCQ